MTEHYDNAVAEHYAAYRPPLHALLFAQLLCANESFAVGLDIGCGTGYSAIALANYCDQVFGLDPSEAMLATATRHPRITYLRGEGDNLSVITRRPINIISFIGSLYYVRSERLRQELGTVCEDGTIVIVGDFEVLLDEMMLSLGLAMPSVNSAYNHGANLLDWREFPAELNEIRRLTLELTSAELGHVLLADSNRFAAFAAQSASRDPFPPLVKELTGRGDKHQLRADLYLARYRYSARR
jgi:SAM-dependent methyltransferase